MINQIATKIGEARSARNRGDNRNAQRLAQAAMEMLEKVEISFDNMDWRLLAQGDAQELANDMAGAEKSYRQAITASPNGSGGYTRLAELFLAQDRTSELLDHLNSSLQKFPDMPSWYKMRGELHRKAGRRQEALNDFVQYLRLNDQDTAVMDTLGQMLQDMGKFQEASLYHAAALEMEPGVVQHALQLARAMDGSGNWDAAEEIYQEILRVRPYQVEAYLGYGLLFHKRYQFAKAEEIYRKAIDAGVRLPALYQNLGDALAEQGKQDDALPFYEKALKMQPDNPTFQFKVASLKGETPATAPRDYVTELFDNFSNNFEQVLVEQLRYQAPGIIWQMIQDKEALIGGTSNAKVLDLGCGTGLLGSVMKGKVSSIDGVDLSQRMLDHAAEKEAYQNLKQSDLVDFVNEAAPGTYNVVTAGDVFIYVGDLKPVFAALSAQLQAPALFAFSVEKLDEEQGSAGFVLGTSSRYQHKESYIRQLAEQNGFKVETIKEDALRQNEQQSVPGLFVLLSK